MTKYVIATLLVIIGTPALAAEYYVAQDPTTKRCNVTREKPDGKASVMVGTAYATKEDAKAAKKANPDCKKREEKS
jgi:hypothetical protein